MRHILSDNNIEKSHCSVMYKNNHIYKKHNWYVPAAEGGGGTYC